MNRIGWMEEREGKRANIYNIDFFQRVTFLFLFFFYSLSFPFIPPWMARWVREKSGFFREVRLV